VNEKPKDDSGQSEFPPLDRTAVSVGDVRDKRSDWAYWMTKTVDERFEAIQLLREIAYGHDAATARLQRVIEVAEFPPR
jgi:hypothetical protein